MVSVGEGGGWQPHGPATASRTGHGHCSQRPNATLMQRYRKPASRGASPANCRRAWEVVVRCVACKSGAFLASGRQRVGSWLLFVDYHIAATDRVRAVETYTIGSLEQLRALLEHTLLPSTLPQVTTAASFVHVAAFPSFVEQ
jgi:hypothetical protein